MFNGKRDDEPPMPRTAQGVQEALLREQRETNRLLRELLTRTGEAGTGTPSR